MLKLDWSNVKSALVYSVLAVALYIISKGSVFGLDWKIMVDVAVLGLLTSLTKNLLTTDNGKFLGVTTVIPDKK